MENITSTPFTGAISTLMNQTQLPGNITSADPTTTVLGATGQAFMFILSLLLQVVFLGISGGTTFVTVLKAKRILHVSPELPPEPDAAFVLSTISGFLLYFGLTYFYGSTIQLSWGEDGSFFEAFMLGGLLALCFWAVLTLSVLCVIWSSVKIWNLWNQRRGRRVEDKEELLSVEFPRKDDENV